MLLRVFAVTDTSELGLACLTWCKFLLALDEPMRIASAAGPANIMGNRQGRSANPWSELRDYFATPLEDEYVNIVMTPMETWDRLWTKRAKRNVAIVARASELDISRLRSNECLYDRLVAGWGDSEPTRAEIETYCASTIGRLPLTDQGSYAWYRPIAANLETFRSVVLP